MSDKNSSSKIHPTAIIDSRAELDSSVSVGAYSVIGANVKIGAGTVIHNHAVIVKNTTIGKNNTFHPFASIGGDPQSLNYKEKSDANIVIGDDNIFRECVTVNLSTTPEGTRIGNHNYIMTSAHIGHDAVIGNHNIMVNYSCLGGHSTLKDFVFCSAYVPLHQHVRVGSYVMIGGLSGVSQDIPPYLMVRGEFPMAYGLNSVGLRRAGFSSELRLLLKKAYKIIFLEGISPRKGCERIRIELLKNYSPESEEHKHLLYFIEFIETSKRGIISANMKEKNKNRDADTDVGE